MSGAEGSAVIVISAVSISLTHPVTGLNCLTRKYVVPVADERGAGKKSTVSIDPFVWYHNSLLPADKANGIIGAVESP